MEFRRHSLNKTWIALLFLILIVPARSSNLKQRADSVRITAEVIVPSFVEANSIFEVEYIVHKAGYTAGLSIEQNLPPGIEPVKDEAAGYSMKLTGKKMTIKWKAIPPKNPFQFNLFFTVADIPPAVYGFKGQVVAGKKSTPFSSLVSVTLPDQTVPDTLHEELKSPLKIYFEYPELMQPGVSFSFVTTLIKKTGYTAGGRLVQYWPEGFIPEKTGLANAAMEIDDRKVTVRWDKMDKVESISIAYPVRVADIVNGIYPVITEFVDQFGFRFEENTGIFIRADEEKQSQVVPEKKDDQVRMYFRETNDEDVIRILYNVDVYDAKGEALLQLDLPRQIDLVRVSEKTFSYDTTVGKLSIRWNSIHEIQQLEGEVQIGLSAVRPAVYPINAAFYLGDALKFRGISWLNTAEPGIVKQQKKAVPEPASMDTTKLFSRLDTLLEQWKKASAGDNKATAKDSVVTRQPTGLNNDTEIEQDAETTAVAEFEGIKSCYSIQVAASAMPEPELQSVIGRLRISQKMYVDHSGKWYRYIVGCFIMLREARDFLEIMQKSGFPDAFIVNYIDGKRYKAIY